MDGVLVDSSLAIRTCADHALGRCGLEPTSDDEARELIGPPLHDGFAWLCRIRGAVATELVPACVAEYRAAYAERSLLDTTLMPGIEAALAEMAAHAVLAVATSKPIGFADPILEQLGIRRCFAVVEGPDLAAIGETKSTTLSRALEALPAGAERAMMVGDRHHDISAALEHGVTPVGATWGYGSRAELVDAGARHLVDSPAQLAALVARR